MKQHTAAGRLVIFGVALAGLISGLAAGWAINGAGKTDPAAEMAIRPLDIPSNLLTVRIVPLVAGEGVDGAGGEAASAARELVSAEGLEQLADSLHGMFPFEYEITEARIVPDEYFDSERGQYRIDHIVDWLGDSHDGSSFRVVGVIAEDVFKPEYNFLFGLANILGPACVASSRRMDGNVPAARTIAAERWHALVAHELGHTLGLPHNETERSVMAYSDTLAGLDRQSTQLSSGDLRRLRKILPVTWVN